MKTFFYLQHPLMAMCDPRMKNLIKKEKLKGLGAYWFIMEKIGLLPESYFELEYLRPFCKCAKISFAYIKKIILEYQLFSMDEDGFFMPEELNPPREKEQEREQKVVQKTTKNTQENAISEAKNIENQKKTSKENANIRENKSHKPLINGDLAKNDLNIKENIRDITTATTEEKEETAAADDDILLKLEVGVKAKLEIRLCIPIACFKTSETTQVTVRNDTGHQPKPRSSVLTSCVIGGTELRHSGSSAVSLWTLNCVIGGMPCCALGVCSAASSKRLLYSSFRSSLKG